VSIALNIAEGAGEFAPREKARFYRIARRSATESAAILDVATRLGLAAPSEVRTAKATLCEIVPMLVRLAKKMESAQSQPKP
jgi:four helix bundle protein